MQANTLAEMKSFIKKFCNWQMDFLSKAKHMVSTGVVEKNFVAGKWIFLSKVKHMVFSAGAVETN